MPGYRQQIHAATLRGDTDVESQAMPAFMSNLVSKLLLQTSHGKMSYSSAQQLAYAAYLDGLTHPEVVALASTGSWGEHPNHCKRDIRKTFFKDLVYAEPSVVRTNARNTKTNETTIVEQCLFLPHKLLHSLFKYDEAPSAFRTDLLSTFWQSVKKDDPRLVALLAETGMDSASLQYCIPLTIHGDGVEYVDGDSLEILSVGPLLGAGNSLDCMFMLAAFPYSCTVKTDSKTIGTWAPAMKKFQWSFNAALEGIHPLCDENGGCLADPQEQSLAGTPLTQNKYKFVIWAITGDHEHHSNFFQMPHWASHHWCWCCNCNKLEPGMDGLEFGAMKKWVDRDVAAELAKRLSPHPIFNIKGVTSFNIEHDPLHVLYCNGVLSHFFGSFLHTLMYHGKGRQAQPPEHRLQVIWQRMQELYKELGSKTRMTTLQMNMITDRKAPHANFPTLKAKGSETKYMVAVFAKLAEELDVGTPESTWRKNAARSIHKFCKLLDDAPIVPSDSQAKIAKDTMAEFLKNYCLLNAWAKASERHLYHLVPKFHMAWHMAKSFHHLNPRYTWTFKTEDYVGKVSKLAHDCTFGCARTNVSRPISWKYRDCVHLRLSRGDFLDD